MSKLLSYKGRMRRRSYVLITVPLSILMFFIGEIIEQTYEEGALFLLYALTIGLSIIVIFQVIKRLHDVGMRGTNWLVMLIPILNIGFGFWLIFKDGEAGENKYGTDTKHRGE